MSNRLRFRSGMVDLHKLRVKEETILFAGDLTWLDGHYVRPASEFPYTTDMKTTLGNFAAKFIGVCHQPSAIGETQPVSIDLSPMAVYEFDVYQNTFEVGDMLTCLWFDGKLHNQTLCDIGDPSSAIARAAEYKAITSSLLRVQFASAFHTASSNVNAGLG